MNDDTTETPARRGRPPKSKDEVAYPERIMMTRPYGYMRDDGEVRMWYPNVIVSNAGEIAEIIERGCHDWKIWHDPRT